MPSRSEGRAARQRKTPRRRRGGPASRARPRKTTATPPLTLEPIVDPVVEPVVEPVAQAVEAEPEPSSPIEAPLSTPEPVFAARVPPPEPDRPLPAARRAIFFDVENSSRAEHIARVIDHLGVDRLGTRTEFIAVGNWKVVGLDTARLLARHGAHLVHSAPSVGVRDWSDLRIAVGAGVWLAAARPGDIVEIVSDDRAFDAVGDVAASLGIAFRRLSYRSLAGMPAGEALVGEAPTEPSSRYRRGDRRGRGWRPPAPAARAHAPGPVPVARTHGAPAADAAAAAPHTAPHDEIVAVVRELMHASPSNSVTIDALANALKSRGFSRPSGSPRLITRLRRIKEISVNRAGLITLAGAAEGDRPGETSATAGEEPAAAMAPEMDHEPVEPVPGAGEPTVDQAAHAGMRRRRRSRRGGRRRRGRGGETPAAT